MDVTILNCHDDPYWDVEYSLRHQEYDRWAVLASEDLRDPRPTDFLVENLIIDHSVTILASPPKSGKTSFATALALAVADGADFIGRKVQQGPVLWLSLEESRFERNDLMRFAPNRPDRPFYIAYHWPFLNGDVAEEALEYWACKSGAKLIVIDPLAAAVTAGVLQDGYSARSLVARYRRVAQNVGTSFLFIHHLTKAQIARPEPRAFADSIQLLASAGMIMHLTSTPVASRESQASDTDSRATAGGDGRPSDDAPPRPRDVDQETRARMDPLDLADLDDEELPAIDPRRHSLAKLIYERTKRDVILELPPVVPETPKTCESNVSCAGGLHVTLSFSGRGVWANGTMLLHNPAPLVYRPIDVKAPRTRAKRMILDLLQEGPATLEEIVEGTSLAEGSVRNCLSTLVRKGAVVIADKDGRTKLYSLPNR